MTFGRTQTERREQREAERERNLRSLCTPSKAIGRGVYTGSTAGAAPKTEPKRNRALLDLAKGRRCLLSVPGVCNGRRDTTVACHSNWSDHGKAGARKADDCYSVWGCAACHQWLDQGTALADEKRYVFEIGHAVQVWWWESLAADTTQPEAERLAAQWALDQLAG